MAYPTYKGDGEQVTDFNGIIDQHLAYNNVGKYAVSVAEYYLKKGCYDNDNKNPDQCVLDFIEEYRGEPNPKYEPYCVMFVYFLYNKAKDCLGSVNYFPSQNEKVYDTYTKKTDVIWGNAYRTEKWLFENRSELIGTKPEPASCYYRHSANSGSSGHWGIVVKVTDKGFFGIEGNIKIDGKEGVGCWFYPNSDYSSIGTGLNNGFRFFNMHHFQKPNKIEDYVYPCKPMPKKEEPIAKNNTGFPCIMTRAELLKKDSALLNKIDNLIKIPKDLTNSQYNDILENSIGGKWNYYIKVENPHKAIYPTWYHNPDMYPNVKKDIIDLWKKDWDIIIENGIFPVKSSFKDKDMKEISRFVVAGNYKSIVLSGDKCYIYDPNVAREDESEDKKPIDEGGKGSYTEDIEEYEKIKKECKTVLFSVPASDMVQHWSRAMKNHWWWADVLGDENVKPYAKRNGSATFYANQDFQGNDNDLKDKYSGIGFAKLSNDVPVYIVNKKHPYAYDLFFGTNKETEYSTSPNQTLFGKDPFIFEFFNTRLWYNSASIEFAKPFNNEKTELGYGSNLNGRTDLSIHAKNNNRNLNLNGDIIKDIRQLPINWVQEEIVVNFSKNPVLDWLPLKEFLQLLDKNNVTNSAVVMVMDDEDFQAKLDEIMYQKMSGVIQMASALIPGVGGLVGSAASTLINGIGTALDVSFDVMKEMRKSGGNPLNALLRFGIKHNNLIIDGLEQTVQYLSPTTLTFVNDKVGEFTEYYEKAKTSAMNLIDYPAPDKVAKLIGLDINEVSKIKEQFGRLNQIPIDLTKDSFKNLEKMSKTIFNLENFLISNEIRKQLSSNSLIQDIINQDFYEDVPVLRKLFSTGGADTVLQMIPRTEQLAKAMTDKISTKDNDKSGKMSAWLAVALGQKPPKHLFAEYEIDSLTKQAQIQFENKMQFIMPPSIDEEIAECYKAEIVQRLEERESEVVVCKEGWNYDFGLKKCVRDNTFVGWEGDGEKTTDKDTSNSKDNFTEEKGNCPEGYLMYQGKCYPETAFKCPEGYTFDKNFMKCVPKPYEHGDDKPPIDYTDKVKEDCEKYKIETEKLIKDLKLNLIAETNRANSFIEAYNTCMKKYNSWAASNKEYSEALNRISNLEIINESLKTQIKDSNDKLTDLQSKLRNCENKEKVDEIKKDCTNEVNKVLIEKDKLTYEYEKALKEIERLKIENKELKNNSSTDNSEVQKIINERNTYYNDLQEVIKEYNKLKLIDNDKSKVITDLQSKITNLENSKKEVIKYVDRYIDNPEHEAELNRVIEEHNKIVLLKNKLEEEVEKCKNIPDYTPPMEKLTKECNECELAKMPSYVEKIERISYGNHNQENHEEEYSDCEEC